MAISFQSALGIREDALTIRAERANILASNLANADTPNFKARDIDFSHALKSRMSMGQANSAGGARMTHQKHMNLDGSTNALRSEHLYRTPNQPSIDGNSVEEQVEHSEFMKNSLEFQTAFTLLNSSFSGLRKAIRGE